MGTHISSPGGAERSLLQMGSVARKYFGYETETVFIDNEHVESEEFTVLDIIPRRILDFSTYELRMLLRFGVPLLRKNVVMEEIEGFEPDLIIAQPPASHIATKIGRERGIPVKTMIQANKLLYKNFFHGRNIITKLVNGPLALLNSRFAKTTLALSDTVVANSRYTASKYGSRYPCVQDKMSVVYPFAEKSNYEVDSTGEKIVHVNPIEPKGIDITLAVAEEMPEEEFLIVGNEGPQHVMDKIEDLPNVEFGGFYEDMKSVYSQAKIMLFPSRNKAFGRIPVEAGYSGIPVITSGVGGLSESSVEELNVDENEAKYYVGKIKRVEDNYGKYSELSRQNAEDLHKKSFEGMKELLGVDGQVQSHDENTPRSPDKILNP